MFIDDIKFRYTYLNSRKNVVWEQDINREPLPSMVELIIHPEMVGLIDKLSRERPTWRFKSAQNFYSASGVLRVTHFTMYDMDEELGTLYVDTHWRDHSLRYYFDNHRLEKARQRNVKNFTTKPEVAAKRILKAFHSRTPAERAAVATSEVRSAMASVVNDVNHRYRRALGGIQDEINAYVLRHWDEVSATFADPARHASFPTLAADNLEAMSISKAMGDGRGVVVRIEHNGNYMVARPTANGHDINMFTDSTLPDHLRGGLGLLKLVAFGSMIDGVGYKRDDNSFFVMDRNEDGSAT